MMSNRRVDTKPEVAFRSALHRAGLRFRKDRYIKLERRGVSVDVVFPSPRVALFIDGCFWHRCPEHATMPKRNSEYWLTKFRRNVERDAEHNETLQELGWRVVRIWEHEVRHPELIRHAVERVSKIVRARKSSASV
jgi:DNA mismatch endonuclease (patch repair protein)